MSRQFAFAAPMISALAVSLSVSTVLTSSSRAAETCIAAPKAPAPQGSHWYYRLDRATQRKCWHLVKVDQQPQRRATPQPEPAEKPGAAPVTETSAEQLPESGTQPAPAWMTSSASATPAETAVPIQGPNPFERVSERADDVSAPPAASVAQEQASDTAAEPAAASPAVQAVQQTNVVAQNAAVAPAAGTGLIQFVFAAVAGIGLLAAAIFALVDARRRRTDVLTRVAREERFSFETPASADGPTFSPLPPMRLTPERDDVDEALQRLRARRRLAA